MNDARISALLLNPALADAEEQKVATTFLGVKLSTAMASNDFAAMAKISREITALSTKFKVAVDEKVEGLRNGWKDFINEQVLNFAKFLQDWQVEDENHVKRESPVPNFRMEFDSNLKDASDLRFVWLDLASSTKRERSGLRASHKRSGELQKDGQKVERYPTATAAVIATLGKEALSKVSTKGITYKVNPITALEGAGYVWVPDPLDPK